PKKMRADFARKRAGFFPVHILRAEFHCLFPTQALRDASQGGERRNDNDLDAFLAANFEEKSIKKGHRFRERHIHLPIGGDDLFAHRQRMFNCERSTLRSLEKPCPQVGDAPPAVEVKVHFIRDRQVTTITWFWQRYIAPDPRIGTNNPIRYRTN